MNQEKLLQDFVSLPAIAQQEVIDFIAFLKIQYCQSLQENANQRPTLESEHFVGIWQNRSTMNDSTAWVRDLRQKEWN